MAYVDSHFHIWELDRFDYSWLTDEHPGLGRNYTANDIEEEMKETPIKYGVFVQVMCKKPEETILDDVQTDPIFKGCRHLTDYEGEKWITGEDVFQGLKVLEDRGLTFDLPILSHQLNYIPDLVRRLPKLTFVLNHISRPNMKKGATLSPWKEDIAAIVNFPNMYCKLDGLVTAGDLVNWKKEDFQPFVDHVIDCFGIDRCMFGSDWPVCTLAAGCNYANVFKLLNELLSALSEEDKEKVFRESAKKILLA